MRLIKKNEFLKINGQIYIFFVEQKGKPICLICNDSVSGNEESNLKRHHELKQELQRM